MTTNNYPKLRTAVLIAVTLALSGFVCITWTLAILWSAGW